MSLKEQMTPEELRRLIRQKAQHEIDEHGCMITAVFPTEGSEQKVWFAYTIGLPVTFPGAPELLIMGLDADAMGGILNDAVSQMREGKRYADGDVVADLVEGISLAVRSVPKRQYREWVGQAIVYHQGLDFGLLQLFWPDDRGRFPWQKSFDKRFKAKQSLLFEEG